ncbi:regulatory lipoprotein [Thioploca ingrica]|uniref:Regulatory lipoprotein n=1 Tax=Thioploca ingrica TaxID=40754 RepID=A0A090AES1_9GAMM|nr:regulatory lipoprotein [Thioploca ingrica]
MKRITQYFVPLLLAIASSISAEQLTVMTSYPQEVVSRFEETFEHRHPEIQLQILWRMPHDALPYLLKPQQGGVDVYWAPSLGNFLALKAAGALGPLGINRNGLPERIGDTLLVDPQGTFLASETAGYGLFINPDKLAKLGVAEPKVWADLTDPHLKGEVVLPVPSGVGYAPVLVDQLLQAEGWEAGWKTWRAIAANSRLITNRGNFVTEEVSSGRATVGLTMDFFAASSVASGAKGKFLYPARTAFNPGQIAITASTPRRLVAETFVTFILSEEGQILLFHPAIRKLPVRSSVYTQAPPGYVNPFTLHVDTRYDPVRGLARRSLNSALFDAAITRHHGTLIEVWALLHQAEVAATPKAQETLGRARAALTALPLSEPAPDAPLALACEQRTEDIKAEAQCAAAEREWDTFFEAHYAEAKALAAEVLRRGGRS